MKMILNRAVQPRKAKTDTTGAWIYHPLKPLAHSDSDLEIVFVLEGELVIRSGQDIRRLKQPDILLLNPQGGLQNTNTSQIRLSPLGDCFFLLVRIGAAFLSSVFGDAVPVFDCDSALQNKDFGALRSILAEIASVDTTNSGNKLLFYSRLYRLLDELTAHFLKQGNAIAEGEGEDEKRRRAILGYIKKNFRFSVSLDELADFLSLSPQYLSRYFKKLFGVNFHTSLMRFRLENALKELVATDNPVVVVAHDNGFPNLTAFNKEMKKTLGLTPTAYRKSYRNQEENPEITREEEMTIDPARIRDKLDVVMGKKAVPSASLKTITVDTQEGVPLARPWQEVINLGFARDIEKAEFMAQVRLIQNETPFRYARFQGLFGENMFSLHEDSDYHFAKIDRTIDLIREAGLLPFIELGSKLTNIVKRSGMFVFDKEDEKENVPSGEYESIIAHFLKHAINRYGMQEVSRWRFEYWIPMNEQQNYRGGGGRHPYQAVYPYQEYYQENTTRRSDWRPWFC